MIHPFARYKYESLYLQSDFKNLTLWRNETSSCLHCARQDQCNCCVVLQVRAKLAKAKQDLARAESAHAKQHAAISNQDNQKKWLKF